MIPNINMLKQKIAKRYYQLLKQARIAKFWAKKSTFKRNQIGTLLFDSSTICTANCIFCAYQFDTRDKETAGLGLFRRTLDQYIQLGGQDLNLTPLTGELFVSNDVIEMIKYANNRGINSISFYTNATLLHKVNLRELLSLNITRIGISVSPFDQKLYKAIYRSDAYSRVIENVSSLLRIAKEINSKIHISIEYRGPLTLEKCNQLDDYRSKIKPFLTNKISFSAFKAEFDTWGGRIKSTDLLEGMDVKSQVNHSPIFPCTRLWNIQVEPSGNVNLCGCRANYNDEISPLYLGNINNNSLENIIKSPKAKAIRQSFFTGNLNDLCKNCSWYT